MPKQIASPLEGIFNFPINVSNVRRGYTAHFCERVLFVMGELEQKARHSRL